MTKNVYIYVCQACSHPAHDHRLTDDGDLRHGPYVCSHCGCSTVQDSPNWEFNEQQWRDFQATDSGRLQGVSDV